MGNGSGGRRGRCGSVPCRYGPRHEPRIEPRASPRRVRFGLLHLLASLALSISVISRTQKDTLGARRGILALSEADLDLDIGRGTAPVPHPVYLKQRSS